MFFKLVQLHKRVNLIIYDKPFHNTKGNTISVCILVWHFVLSTTEGSMIFSMAIYIMLILLCINVYQLRKL